MDVLLCRFDAGLVAQMQQIQPFPFLQASEGWVQQINFNKE